MGCDIHMFAEYKKSHPHPSDSSWVMVGHYFVHEWYHEERPTSIYWSDWGEVERNAPWSLHPYDRRNYSLFAILANVRNGYGFAGVDTGDGFIPITMPRGVPEDASSYYKKLVEDYALDGHSHSYLTLTELEAYDWSQVTTKRGWVNQEQFKVFVREGRPSSWSGSVQGGGVLHVSNEYMQDSINVGNLSPKLYTQVEWQQTYASSCEDFLNNTMPQLRKIAAMELVEDVRIVFFFDS